MAEGENTMDQPNKLGRTKIKIDCQALADKPTLLPRDINTTQKQI